MLLRVPVSRTSDVGGPHLRLANWHDVELEVHGTVRVTVGSPVPASRLRVLRLCLEFEQTYGECTFFLEKYFSPSQCTSRYLADVAVDFFCGRFQSAGRSHLLVDPAVLDRCELGGQELPCLETGRLRVREMDGFEVLVLQHKTERI